MRIKWGEFEAELLKGADPDAILCGCFMLTIAVGGMTALCLAIVYGRV